MKKNVVKDLRNTIFEHIVTNKNGYKNFSAEQKVQYVVDAFTNVNALCCELWDTNPNLNNLWFMFGESSNAIAETIGNASFIAFSAKEAIEIEKPESIYRLLMHEMRHLYQQQKLYRENDNECLSYYANNNTHAAWAASPSEKGANAFAYSELLKILGKGIVKSDEKVSAGKSFFNISWLGAQCFADHTLGSIRYRLDEKHDFFKKTSKPLGVGLDEDFGGKAGFVSSHRLLNMVAQNSEIFGVKNKYTQEMHDVIAEESQDGFQELVNVILQANQANAPAIVNPISYDVKPLDVFQKCNEIENFNEDVFRDLSSVEDFNFLRLPTQNTQQDIEQ